MSKIDVFIWHPELVVLKSSSLGFSAFYLFNVNVMEDVRIINILDLVVDMQAVNTILVLSL